MVAVLKNMRAFIVDMLTTIIYMLTFIVPPLIVGSFFGHTAERFAFGIVTGYLAWRWSNIFLQLEHANELAKKYLEEESKKHETD